MPEDIEPLIEELISFVNSPFTINNAETTIEDWIEIHGGWVSSCSLTLVKKCKFSILDN